MLQDLHPHPKVNGWMEWYDMWCSEWASDTYDLFFLSAIDGCVVAYSSIVRREG